MKKVLSVLALMSTLVSGYAQATSSEVVMNLGRVVPVKVETVLEKINCGLTVYQDESECVIDTKEPQGVLNALQHKRVERMINGVKVVIIFDYWRTTISIKTTNQYVAKDILRALEGFKGSYVGLMVQQ